MEKRPVTNFIPEENGESLDDTPQALRNFLYYIEGGVVVRDNISQMERKLQTLDKEEGSLRKRLEEIKIEKERLTDQIVNSKASKNRIEIRKNDQIEQYRKS